MSNNRNVTYKLLDWLLREPIIIHLSEEAKLKVFYILTFEPFLEFINDNA